MKSYWTGMLMGAILGVGASVYYLNNEKYLQQRAQELKSKSQQAKNFMSNMGEEISDTIGKQG